MNPSNTPLPHETTNAAVPEDTIVTAKTLLKNNFGDTAVIRETPSSVTLILSNREVTIARAGDHLTLICSEAWMFNPERDMIEILSPVADALQGEFSFTSHSYQLGPRVLTAAFYPKEKGEKVEKTQTHLPHPAIEPISAVREFVGPM